MPDINASVVLTDIEGTTTSISFVKDVLFPFAKANLCEHLSETWQSDTTKELIQQLVQLPEYVRYFKDVNFLEPTVETLSEFINYLIDKDLKLGPLKSLQGLVWAKGYEQRTLKGHIYDDVPAAFKRWNAAGIKIAIYSSGSVKAQKLLFGYSTHGDLLPYINAYFDTEVGHKQDSKSYENIAKALNVPSADILFLTDIIGEAAAAREAGMSTVILNRSGNAPLTDDEKVQYTLVNNFDELKVTPK